MSVPIESLHEATETPACGSCGQGWKGRFLNSTERRASKCVRVEVHERADRLKFLSLGMPCVACIRGLKHQRRLLPPSSTGVLPKTCRVLVWLGGLEVAQGKGKIWEPVRHKRNFASGTSSQVWRARDSKLIQ